MCIYVNEYIEYLVHFCTSLHVLCSQVFSELQDIGKDIKEEVQDIGFPAHGDMGGDISKCPYYAAKMGEEVIGSKSI